MTALERLEDLLYQYDGDVNFSIASASMWSGQLRLTLTNPVHAPSRSVTFYCVAGESPDEIAETLLADFEAWRKDSGMEPMSVPE